MAVVEGKAKVTLDGAEAGQQLDKLETQAAELRREIVAVRKEPLVDQKKLKSLQTQLKGVQNETKQIREQTVSYKKVLDNLSGASLNKLNSAYRKLNKEVKTLDRNTKEYKQKAADLAKLRTEITKVKNEMKGAGTSSKGFAASLKNIGSQLFGALGIVGGITMLIGAVTKLTKDFIELNKINKKVEQMFGLTGIAAKSLTAEIKAVSDAFEVDYTETMIAANTVSKEFGITGSEAMSLIEEGLKKGSNNSGEFLDILKEYPTQFKQAGIDAETMFAIINQQVTEGIYSDKGIDAIKEAGLRLRENNKATQDALSILDKNIQLQIRQRVEEGKTFEAIKLVSKELNNTNLSAQDTQKIIADVFGGPGEDAGLRYLQTLKDINSNLDDVASQMSVVDEASLELGKSYNLFVTSVADSDGTISQSLAAVYDYLSDIFDTLTLFNVADFKNKIKILINEALKPLNAAIYPVVKAWEFITGKKIDFKFELDIDDSALNNLEKVDSATKEVTKSEKDLKKVRDNAAKDLEKQQKEREKAKQAEAKANQQLADQIKAMNVQMIQDDYERSQAELQLWYEKEQRKIETSKASADQKNTALETLEQLHLQKMTDLRINYEAEISAMLEEQMQKEIEAKQLAEEQSAAEAQAELERLEQFENDKFNIRQYYGLVQIAELRAREEAELQQAYDDGLLTEKEFQESKFKVKMHYADMWVQKYSAITNALAGFFEAQKQAELEAAGDNEEAKKKIMKKYADKEFAVKVAQIGASTAQAIMQAYAQLGPVAGAIAAALLGATGLMQIARANSERQKVKGLASGGWFQREQDGRNYYAEHGGSKRGYIERPTVLVGEEGPEFVVSNKSLHIPAVRNMVDIIDTYQRSGSIPSFNYNRITESGNVLRGFASGGYTTEKTDTQTAETTTDINMTMIEEIRGLREDINEWQRNLKTYVVYEDIEDAGEELNAIKADVTL